MVVCENCIISEVLKQLQGFTKNKMITQMTLEMTFFCLFTLRCDMKTQRDIKKAQNLVYDIKNTENDMEMTCFDKIVTTRL